MDPIPVVKAGKQKQKEKMEEKEDAPGKCPGSSWLPGQKKDW